MKVETYASFENRINPRILEEVAASLIKGSEPKVVKPVDSEGRYKPWSSITLLLNREMQSRIDRFLSRFDHFDVPEKVASSLVETLLERVGLEKKFEKSDFLYFGSDPVVEAQVDLWRALTGVLGKKLSPLLTDLVHGLPKETKIPGWLNMKKKVLSYPDSLSFGDWFELIKLIDRVRELEKLNSRA